MPICIGSQRSIRMMRYGAPYDGTLWFVRADVGASLFYHKRQIINLFKEIFMNNSEIITLYHGSKEGIQGDIAPVSRVRCDFGRRFYMGTD